MEQEPEHPDLIAQLRALQTDYDEMRILAFGIETRGYAALLGGVAFAGRARELRDRAVRLFDRAAHALRADEEVRNIRLRLLETSRQLAALFSDGTAG